MIDIYGTDRADRLVGGPRNEELIGRDGDDRLFGGAGDDALYGGADDDTLDGGAGSDELNGGRGADLFIYGAGRDEIEGLRPQQGDRVRIDPALGISDIGALRDAARPLDDGDDTLIDFGGGNTLLLEDFAIGRIDGDVFSFGAPPRSGPVTPPGAGGGQGTTSEDDLLRGNSGRNDIEGRGGDDRLFGRGGRDDLDGGAGNDRLFGGRGRDDLDGGAGRDRLDGGRGNDDLDGGAGDDVFIASRGRDEIGDFGAGDRIKLRGWTGLDDFDAVFDAARPAGGGDDVILNLGRGASLRLDDVSRSELEASDFIFA